MLVPSMALTPKYDESLNSMNRNGKGSSESINIYLTLDGSVIPMRILESDSIASVKLRIEASKGFFVKRQKLVFEGRELARNDSPVRDYGIGDGKMLHLVLRISDLQAITVKTLCGKELQFHVQRSRNVGYVKHQIAQKEGGFLDFKDQELICNGEELEDQRLVNDIWKNSDAVIHLLVRNSAKVKARSVQKDLELSIERDDYFDTKDSAKELELNPKFSRLQIADTQRDFVLEPLIVNSDVELLSVIEELIDNIRSGLEKGNRPIRSSEGTGGTYFMQDSSGLNYIAVFKPIDEEPMAANNPRDLGLSHNGEGLKKGTRVGEGAMREVAAYILDHPRDGARTSFNEKGFSGVPPTVMIKCLHREFYHPKGYKFCPENMKIGSLQMYVKNDGSCEEIGPQHFLVEDVHKISVLDIRLANADRHAGNILIQKDDRGQFSLIPIDHGYCLPENFEDCTFEWLNWPQSHRPYSHECVDYIKALDADPDIQLLKLHGWNLPPECARNLHVSTMLLKKGAERGLSPFAIGSVMCRETLNKESTIEQIIREANEVTLLETGETAFLESVSMIMDRHLDELSAKTM